MQHKYTIPTSDITNADVRPLHRHLATLSDDWREVFGSLTINCAMPAGHSQTSRYWRTAIATIPWLPFVLSPTQPCVVDLVVAQLPRAIREESQHDLAALESHVRAVLREWNMGIVVIALVAGVAPARLTAHMDAIASHVMSQLGADVTLSE